MVLVSVVTLPELRSESCSKELEHGFGMFTPLER